MVSLSGFSIRQKEHWVVFSYVFEEYVMVFTFPKMWCRIY